MIVCWGSVLPILSNYKELHHLLLLTDTQRQIQFDNKVHLNRMWGILERNVQWMHIASNVFVRSVFWRIVVLTFATPGWNWIKFCTFWSVFNYFACEITKCQFEPECSISSQVLQCCVNTMSQTPWAFVICGVNYLTSQPKHELFSSHFIVKMFEFPFLFLLLSFILQFSW